MRKLLKTLTMITFAVTLAGTAVAETDTESGTSTSDVTLSGENIVSSVGGKFCIKQKDTNIDVCGEHVLVIDGGNLVQVDNIPLKTTSGSTQTLSFRWGDPTIASIGMIDPSKFYRFVGLAAEIPAVMNSWNGNAGFVCRLIQEEDSSTPETSAYEVHKWTSFSLTGYPYGTVYYKNINVIYGSDSTGFGMKGLAISNLYNYDAGDYLRYGIKTDFAHKVGSITLRLKRTVGKSFCYNYTYHYFPAGVYQCDFYVYPVGQVDEGSYPTTYALPKSKAYLVYENLSGEEVKLPYNLWLWNTEDKELKNFLDDKVVYYPVDSTYVAVTGANKFNMLTNVPMEVKVTVPQLDQLFPDTLYITGYWSPSYSCWAPIGISKSDIEVVQNDLPDQITFQDTQRGLFPPIGYNSGNYYGTIFEYTADTYYVGVPTQKFTLSYYANFDTDGNLVIKMEVDKKQNDGSYVPVAVRELNSGTSEDLGNLKYYYQKAKLACSLMGADCSNVYLLIGDEKVTVFDTTGNIVTVIQDPEEEETIKKIKDALTVF